MSENTQAFTVQHVARKSYNPRNGEYYSLRIIAREGSEGYEYARIRQEQQGWNAWADDRDFDRLLKSRVRQAKNLEEAHEAAKKALHEWESQ